MKNLFFTIFLFVLPLFVVGQTAIKCDNCATLKGVVTDNNTGEPISLAEVILRNECGENIRKFITGLDGKYKFNNLQKNCRYNIFVNKNAIYSASKEEGIEFKNKRKRVINISLKPIVFVNSKPRNVVKRINKTGTKTIEVTPATTKWVKRKSDKNALSANPDDCLVWCLVETPAEYVTIPKTTDPNTRIEVVPAAYETVTEQVLSKAASTRIVALPAEYEKVHEIIEVTPGKYETITKTVLVTPATTRVIEVPAEYQTVTKKVVKNPAQVRVIDTKTGKIIKTETATILPPTKPIVRKSRLKAGQLTAGEMNDFSKWELWENISKIKLNKWQKYWNMKLEDRYTVQVVSKKGIPIVDSKVRLLSNSKEILWEGRTDNLGKSELWLNVFGKKHKANHLLVEVVHDDKIHTLKDVTLFKEGVNTLKIKAACNPSNAIDVAFVVDATASMADEINYLKAELEDVIYRVQESRTDLSINLGSVFYKDRPCSYLTKKSDFSTNIQQTLDFIQAQKTESNTTVPELIDQGLQVAIEELEWREEAVARLLFLVLDAPPHYNPEVLDRMRRLTKLAAKKGIRIVPIVCSGTDKKTEYLMRSLALATNGTYVYLTDDSGIGNKHIAPTGAKSKVEKLNDLLVRLFEQFTYLPPCDDFRNLVEEENEITDEPTTSSSILKYYPNPTKGNLTLELDANLPELFITDYTGKIIERHLNLEAGRQRIDLSNLPSGIYFLSYVVKDQRQTEKVIVVH